MKNHHIYQSIGSNSQETEELLGGKINSDL